MMSCLEEVNQQILYCPICQQGQQASIVVGEGGSRPLVAFIGEAPGKTEIKLHRPFVGRSGQLLRRLIQSIGLQNEQYYITSAVKYLPPYVTPKESDIVHGRTHLFAQLECLQPKIVVLLGKSAIWSVLDKKVPIASVHGTVDEQQGRVHFLTIHPAAAVRNQRYDRMLTDDFKHIQKLLVE